MFLTKQLRLVLQSITVVAVLAACVGATILYAGVNESGGEFGVFGSPGTGLPGEFGVTYDFITESTVDTFVDTNQINFFRVTFLMERMCPLATGLGSTFNETYFSEYEDAINYITVTKGAYALIDPHNYMRYNDPSSQPNSGSIIGDTTDPNAATTEQFQEFWTELANRFVDNPNVVFGINNEPHDMATSLILQNDQAAINGIRSTGATQLILAPGNGFTGGHSWTQVTGANDDPSSEWLNQIVDPLNNTAIDIHEYLDEDFSGSHDTCTQPGPTNLAALTTWLQENNLKAIVSEFGGSNDPTCLELVPQLISYLSENDVYIGWSAWAAGPFWGTNSPCCGPEVGSLEPGQLDEEGGPNGYTTVWQAVIQPNINLSGTPRNQLTVLCR
ncbi:endoglucanase 1 [Lentinula edodes]|uniref:endoglucanase 1 n=1 Tax=Lentinula edodes TaxID=5353 RepID=UPI001E8E1E41|nr:endoglucanase 1 [Lentinula edodes]KAH7879311.1 endoglucanase 1 [Lentinula edodes]